MKDPFILPVDSDRLYGTNCRFSANMIREYTDIINGDLFKSYIKGKEHKVEELGEVLWIKNVLNGSVEYRALLIYDYPEEGWVTGPGGNEFFYMINAEKEFNLPVDIEIRTTMGRLDECILPIKTTIRIVGDNDTLILFRLTY